MILYKSSSMLDGLWPDLADDIARVLLRFGDLGFLEEMGREVFFLFKLWEALGELAAELFFLDETLELYPTLTLSISRETET